MNDVCICRPKYHFTPLTNWMNDPNGLIFMHGYYHIFYQHHPFSEDWGPMHWGHARSKDLLSWEHLPIALYPDEHGTIFSGSIVYDSDNQSGLVPGGGLIALFSYSSQAQGLAYSIDEGITWYKYDKNPIIAPLFKNFRDPKVIKNGDHWIMSIAAGDRVLFFKSRNLLDWDKTGEFNASVTDGVWECPDLFKMSIGDDIKWVLIISFGSNAIGGGSGTGYFIGNFENGCFYAEAPMKWIDYGRDNYAGVTWNNTDKDRRIFIAWMNNWIYANYTPTKPWRGSMTVARNLELSKINNEYWLVQKPVLPEASEIFTVHEFEPGIISGKQVLARDVPGVYQLEFNINFINKGHLIIGLSETDQEGTYLHINTIDQHAKLDRSKSGIIDFEKSFASTPYCPLLTSSIIDVRIFVDATAIEIFLYEGIRVISSQVFPRQHGGSVSFNSVEGIQQIPTVKYTQYSEASRPKVQEQLHV